VHARRLGPPRSRRRYDSPLPQGRPGGASLAPPPGSAAIARSVDSMSDGCWSRGEFSATFPASPWGRSSAGRAPALQAGGRRFESARLHPGHISSATRLLVSPHRRSGHPATRRRLGEDSDGDSSSYPSCWIEGVRHRREIEESLELVTAALGQLIYRGSVDAHVSPPTQRGHERRSSVRKSLPSFAAHRVEGRTRHRRTHRGDYLDRELGLPVLTDESAAHARLVPSAAIACIITTPPLLPSR
jgi:hypothetical protein